jgi:hypothetical protein
MFVVFGGGGAGTARSSKMEGQSKRKEVGDEQCTCV